MPTTGEPALDKHAVVLRGSGPASLGLYDLQGRSVWQQQVGALGAGVHRVVVPRGAAARAGVYFLRLESAAGVAKGKIVIVR